MHRLKILKYCLQELTFTNPQKLSFIGTFTFYVKNKEVFRKNMNISSSSKYMLCLESEDKKHSGIIFVKADNYDKAKIGKEFGTYGVIINKKGDIRFSKKKDSTEAMNEIVTTAKKIVFQSMLVLIFLGIPTFVYLLYIVTLMI